ncbi:MAG: hypothetical protein OCU12_07100 [Methanophagales archaeon]|nr:hypothetical protein [Methanophagales archaeon]
MWYRIATAIASAMIKAMWALLRWLEDVSRPAATETLNTDDTNGRDDDEDGIITAPMDGGLWRREEER